jgi:CubicO group peptidase (beta-lactamase class C family)
MMLLLGSKQKNEDCTFSCTGGVVRCSYWGVSRKMKIARFLALVVLCGCASTAYKEPIEDTSLDSIRNESLNYELEANRAISAFDSTGLVAAVMVDGKVVYEGAFGKAEEGTDRLVTINTLVPIGSISKAFTTTALAILVDRDLVEWDAPIRTYIPEFAVYDPWVSENFTVRDALTHRSGLPLGAGDLLIVPDGKPNIDEIIAALPHLVPESGFRSEYAYDNLLYMVAGEVVARVSGKSWIDFVTEEIFGPVGLDNCVADASRLKPEHAIVTGHSRTPGADSGTPVDERFSLAPVVAAAGGVFCTAGDMMIWAKFWLDGGVTSQSERLVSEEQAEELWTGVTPLGQGSSSGLTNLILYALGWIVRDFEGTLAISHGGGVPGVASNFILIPEKGIAVFASSNDYRPAATVLTSQIADRLLGEQNFDFIERIGVRFNENMEAAIAATDDAISPPSDAQHPSLSLSAYTGTYRDPWYGDVTISMKNDALFIDMSRSEMLDGPLTAYNGDQFAALWPDRSLNADAFVSFTVEAGQVTGIKMKAISEFTDFSFDFHDLNLVKQETSP